jgi:hypothetical protein
MRIEVPAQADIPESAAHSHDCPRRLWVIRDWISQPYRSLHIRFANKRWRNGDREPSQASGFELAKIDLRRSIAAIVTAISCLSLRVDVQN